MDNLNAHAQKVTQACQSGDTKQVVNSCCDLLKATVAEPDKIARSTQSVGGGIDTQKLEECEKACQGFVDQQNSQPRQASAQNLDPASVVQLVQLVMYVVNWFRSWNQQQ